MTAIDLLRTYRDGLRRAAERHRASTKDVSDKLDCEVEDGNAARCDREADMLERVAVVVEAAFALDYASDQVARHNASRELATALMAIREGDAQHG